MTQENKQRIKNLMNLEVSITSKIHNTIEDIMRDKDSKDSIYRMLESIGYSIEEFTI